MTFYTKTKIIHSDSWIKNLQYSNHLIGILHHIMTDV